MAYCSSIMAQYTHDTSPARKTQPILHPEAFMQTQTFFCPISPSQMRSPHMSSTSMIPSSTLGVLMGSTLPAAQERDRTAQGEQNLTKPPSSSNTVGKSRNFPLPPAMSTTKKRPGPYPKNLTLKPSLLRPLCPARDRVHMWLPSPSATTSRNGLSFNDQRRIPEVMIHAWEENTQETYGSGLLVYHVFCDANGTPESK